MSEKRKDLSDIFLNDEVREDEPLYNMDGAPRQLKGHSWSHKNKLITTITLLPMAVIFAVSMALALQREENSTGLKNLKISSEVKKIERLRETNPGAINVRIHQNSWIMMQEFTRIPGLCCLQLL
jgi:hypothetical protein